MKEDDTETTGIQVILIRGSYVRGPPPLPLSSSPPALDVVRRQQPGQQGQRLLPHNVARVPGAPRQAVHVRVHEGRVPHAQVGEDDEEVVPDGGGGGAGELLDQEGDQALGQGLVRKGWVWNLGWINRYGMKIDENNKLESLLVLCLMVARTTAPGLPYFPTAAHAKACTAVGTGADAPAGPSAASRFTVRAWLRTWRREEGAAAPRRATSPAVKSAAAAREARGSRGASCGLI